VEAGRSREIVADLSTAEEGELLGVRLAVAVVLSAGEDDAV
jgi:hypothetical protein